MSNVTPSPLPDKDHAVYLRDMLDFCEQVIAYTTPVDLSGLLGERMRFDATLRNRVAHTYVGLDGPTLWKVVSENVPGLRIDLLALLARLENPAQGGAAP
jgi:uncharacterized protein with HEPN domain